MSNIIPLFPKVAERDLKIGRLEKWWIAYNSPNFYPKGRKHLFGSLFWRICKKKDDFLE